MMCEKRSVYNIVEASGEILHSSISTVKSGCFFFFFNSFHWPSYMFTLSNDPCMSVCVCVCLKVSGCACSGIAASYV